MKKSKWKSTFKHGERRSVNKWYWLQEQIISVKKAHYRFSPPSFNWCLYHCFSLHLRDPSSELGSTISIVLLWHHIMCMPWTLGIQLLMIPSLPMLSVCECQVHNYIKHSKWSANMFVSCDLEDKTCIFQLLYISIWSYLAIQTWLRLNPEVIFWDSLSIQVLF